MKRLKITDEERKKVVKMFKFFFPEYGHVDFYKDNEGSEYLYAFLKTNDSDLYDNCDLFIHWYELCYRYLMSKLDDLYFEKVMDPVDPFSKQNRSKKITYPENWKHLWENRPFLQYHYNMNGMNPKKPPVQWLYKQFKKLKK